jgi:hypothetical protein
MSQSDYVQEINQRIKKRFEARYGTKKAIAINVVATVILNLALYFLLFFLWGKDVANQQIASFLVLTVALEITILGVSWVIWRFVDIPLEINKEHIKRIKELSEEAAKIKMDFESFPRYADGYASIKVHNRDVNDLTGCTLSLLDAQIITTNKTESILDKVNPDNAYISWGGGNTKKGTIIGKSASTFNLAKCNGDTFLFLLDNGCEQSLRPGLYKFKIAIDGKVDKKKFKRKNITFFVEYRVEIIKIPIQDGGEINYAVKKATYLDIRTVKEKIKEIEPSQLIDLEANAFFRFIVQDAKDQKAQMANDEK